MAGKQIEFDEMQTHDKKVERAVLIASVVCVIFVLICIQVVGGA
ncbi:MAG: hypothetical protein OXB90_04325 [Acidimicrobiaceae bacterium]|nr:hypothetical protein [Acidimicrobiaceae bacterium]